MVDRVLLLLVPVGMLALVLLVLRVPPLRFLGVVVFDSLGRLGLLPLPTKCLRVDGGSVFAVLVQTAVLRLTLFERDLPPFRRVVEDDTREPDRRILRIELELP